MAKQEKVRTIYAEKYKKGVVISTQEVKDLVLEHESKMTVELIEKGELSNGGVYMTVKLIINP
jgi:hypothetical protein